MVRTYLRNNTHDSGLPVEYGFCMNLTSSKRFPKNFALGLVVFVFAPVLFAACGDEGEGFRNDPRFDPTPPDATPFDEAEDGELPGRTDGDRTYGIWPQVWSQHAPGIQSWEYKVNCGEASGHEEPCFLSDLTSVAVTTPSGDVIELEQDFNTNDYSGEITRRWVRYGPEDGDLPERGDYVFSYSRGPELLYEQAVAYESDVISYPTNVEWKRTGSDIVVNWTPPSIIHEGSGVVLQSNHNPGDFFPLGTSSVNYNVVGIESLNPSCNFTIHVDFVLEIEEGWNAISVPENPVLSAADLLGTTWGVKFGQLLGVILSMFFPRFFFCPFPVLLSA